METKTVSGSTCVTPGPEARPGAATIRERPILFRAEMIRAILEGRKSQTRRVVTKHNSVIGEGGDWNKLCWDGSEVYRYAGGDFVTDEVAPMPWIDPGFGDRQYLKMPYRWAERAVIYRVYPRWIVGDRLWVRETWFSTPDKHELLGFVADGDIPHGRPYRVRPSIFMPCKYSRLALELTDVRAQLLHSMTGADARAEGIDISDDLFPSINSESKLIQRFASQWDSIYGPGAWERDGWVWALTFKVLRQEMPR